MPNQTTPIDRQPDLPGGDNPLRARPCPGCHANLVQVPNVARYCPRCGRDLQLAAPSPIETEIESTPAPDVVIETRSTRLSLPVSDDADPSPSGEWRSPILRGFAHAMYLLGRRYEGALGAQHNPTEALRCYDKAAKLGNSAAIKRLDDGMGDIE